MFFIQEIVYPAVVLYSQEVMRNTERLLVHLLMTC